MQLKVEKVAGAIVVGLPGDHLDASNVEEFKEAMSTLLANHSQMLLDLGSLGFVDSSGLGAILSCLRQIKAKDGSLKVFGMTEQVRLLFDLVRLHRLVEVIDTREEALAALEGQAV